MSRRLITTVVLVPFYLAVCVSFVQAELKKISPHVWALVDVHNASPAANSFGANSGVVVGRDGVLVIDTLVSAKEAGRLLAEIRAITDKPIRFVVNTHYHLDHAWGNGVFVGQGATVIAQDNTTVDFARSETGLAHASDYGLTPAEMEGTTLAPPTLSFSRSMRIELGDVSVDLEYPGPTHTSGSITAYIPHDKVLFVGDILFTGYHPFLAEGDISNWQKVLADLKSTPATLIVPGHGPVSTPADLEDMRVYLGQFDSLAKELCAGKTQNDAPLIAQEMLKRLPAQARNELPGLIEANLRARYLPQAGK